MAPVTADSTDGLSRWGERQLLAGVSTVAAVTAGVLAASDPLPAALAVLLAVVVTVVVPLGFDGFVGLLVGLLASSGLVVAKQLTGSWTPEAFGRSLLTTGALLLAGWAAGRLGKRLRAMGGRPPTTEDVAMFGSMGLVDAAAATARLEEEAMRAVRHGRPLSVLLMRTTATDDALDPASTAAALRVAARHLEAALRRTDVPFALSPEVVGAILPETGPEGAWEVAGSVVESAVDSSFTHRARRERVRLGEHTDIAAGIASVPIDGRDAESLLSAALASLGDVERAEAGVGSPGGTPA